MKRFKKWWVVAGALGILLIVARLAPKEVAVPDLRFAFVGLTNSVAGNAYVIFSVTNQHGRPVDFAPGGLELNSAGRWSGGTTYGAYGGVGRVAPNGVTNCLVGINVPTNSLWRVGFRTAFPPTKIQHWRKVLEVNVKAFVETGRSIGWNAAYPLDGTTNFSEPFRVPYGY